MHRLSSFAVFAGVGLLLATAIPGLSQTPSAKDVVERFCKLDVQGEQLSPEGWNKLAALFVNPGIRRIDKVMVVKEFGVGRRLPDKDKVGFWLLITPLGEIDPAESSFSPLPSSLEIKDYLYVVKQSEGGSGEWRIEGPYPGPTYPSMRLYAM